MSSTDLVVYTPTKGSKPTVKVMRSVLKITNDFLPILDWVNLHEGETLERLKAALEEIDTGMFTWENMEIWLYGKDKFQIRTSTGELGHQALEGDFFNIDGEDCVEELIDMITAELDHWNQFPAGLIKRYGVNLKHHGIDIHRIMSASFSQGKHDEDNRVRLTMSMGYQTKTIGTVIFEVSKEYECKTTSAGESVFLRLTGEIYNLYQEEINDLSLLMSATIRQFEMENGLTIIEG